MSDDRNRQFSEEHRPEKSCVERCSAILDTREMQIKTMKGREKLGRAQLLKTIATLVEVVRFHPCDSQPCNSTSREKTNTLFWPPAHRSAQTQIHTHQIK